LPSNLPQKDDRLEIIDIHPHVISKDHIRYPFDPVGGKMSAWSLERPVDCDEMIKMMGQAGVRKSVIVHASTAYGYDNSYAADCAAAYPRLFRFIGAVDVTAADAPEKLRYWVNERGMVGFRIFAQGSTTGEGSGEWLDDPATFPAWETARELGIPVCVQTRFGSFPRLRNMLERFSDVKVIVDHIGYPPVEDGPPYEAAKPFFEMAGCKNLYVKLTERNFEGLTKGKATPQSFIEKTVAAFGSDHIAWGSNFPSSAGTLPELLMLARRELAFLPLDDQFAIFAGTARTLYPSLVNM
jgi:predicted TIM-barrel fold metal-dependent hydrolase